MSKFDSFIVGHPCHSPKNPVRDRTPRTNVTAVPIVETQPRDRPQFAKNPLAPRVTFRQLVLLACL